MRFPGRRGRAEELNCYLAHGGFHAVSVTSALLCLITGRI